MTCFLDLFAGLGGFALGAFRAGLRFDAHYYSEVDDYASSIYAARFPDAIPLGDIRGIHGADLPRGSWIFCGGFPCQDISGSGKGAGLDGGRSGLWFQYARLIGEVRPDFAVVENVGLLASRGLDRVLGSLAEVGYDAEWQDIRASDVGAPHRRERIWIVGYPSGSRLGGIAWGRAGAESVDGHLQLETSDVAAPEGEPVRTGLRSGEPGRFGGGRLGDSGSEGEGLADASGIRVEGHGAAGLAEPSLQAEEGLSRRDRAGRRRAHWRFEPALGCLVDGLPDGVGRFEGKTSTSAHKRADQLRCLGNSIVPEIAELILSQPAFDH